MMRKADRWRVPGSSSIDGHGWKRGPPHGEALSIFQVLYTGAVRKPAVLFMPPPAGRPAIHRFLCSFTSERIFITGFNILLGQKLVAALHNDPETLLIWANVQRSFFEVHPDAVIPTTGMTEVDAGQLDPEACHPHNVIAVEHLVNTANRVSRPTGSP